MSSSHNFRSKYIDVDFEKLTSLTLNDEVNLAQYKMDGWFAQIESNIKGDWKAVTREGNLIKTGHGLPANTILLAEYLFGTQWSKARADYDHFIVFDCVCHNGTIILDNSYGSRMHALRSFLSLEYNKSKMRLMPSRQLVHTPEMWQECERGIYEGLIFRHTKAGHTTPVYRMKTNIEETYICVGFVEGKNRLTGTLGALKAITQNGKETTVGGGFSDDDRRDIWENQTMFLQRQFDVAGKKRFESGALRHPNFLRWKHD